MVPKGACDTLLFVDDAAFVGAATYVVARTTAEMLESRLGAIVENLTVSTSRRKQGNLVLASVMTVRIYVTHACFRLNAHVLNTANVELRVTIITN